MTTIRPAFLVLPLMLVSFLSFPRESQAAVEINWGAFCPTDPALLDENDRNLKGAMEDPDTILMCGHGPYDLVYLVWDRDVDGVESFDCARKLSGDTIVDSSYIGTGVFCPTCSTGGFSDSLSWTVTTGDYDTFYVIALNDSTLQSATRFGTTLQHNPSVWVVHKDSLSKTIACTENGSWNAGRPFDEFAVFNGTSIVSGGLLPGDRKVGMVRIAARVYSGRVLFTSLQVDNGPSAGCTNDYLDIDSVKIYREVSGSGFDPAEDLLIGEEAWGPGPPDGGSATVTFFSPETLKFDSSYYYIAFDISTGANREHCAAACVQDSSYVGISEFCRDGNFPFCSEDVGLPVEISRFEAYPGDRLVVLEWTTESEIDNRGFHVYRSLHASGDFSRVNEELIPGAGNSYMRLDYRYTDTGLSNGREYFYKLVSVTYGNALRAYDGIASAVPTREGRSARERVGFLGLGPNPFAAATTVSFCVVDGPPHNTSVCVYDVSGRLVRTLAEGALASGNHLIEWDGSDDSGSPAPPGIYFFRLTDAGLISVMKAAKLDF